MLHVLESAYCSNMTYINRRVYAQLKYIYIAQRTEPNAENQNSGATHGVPYAFRVKQVS